MDIWLYESKGNHWDQLVLFDGENTYWSEEMQPSGGYTKKRLNKICPITGGRFTKVGEL